jgi:hypothetical protein
MFVSGVLNIICGAAILSKFGLHAHTVEFNTQNNERIYIYIYV